MTTALVSYDHQSTFNKVHGIRPQGSGIRPIAAIMYCTYGNFRSIAFDSNRKLTHAQ